MVKKNTKNMKAEEKAPEKEATKQIMSGLPIPDYILKGKKPLI